MVEISFRIVTVASFVVELLQMLHTRAVRLCKRFTNLVSSLYVCICYNKSSASQLDKAEVVTMNSSATLALHGC